jgi:single-stranded-DNA-specific exonuclease
MTRWLDPQPIDVPAALRETVGGHPLVAETLARRGFLTPETARAFLDPDAYTPSPPTDLLNLSVAAVRLRQAIEHRERIAVWGDFDADGLTATALLFETLRALGADVVYYVPSRHEGHGLHRHSLERLVAEGARLILTCDTGISAHAAVADAHRLGAEVVITDHHVPGESVPPALAIVNPHLLPSPDHPLWTLTGVGVAYQLAQALNPTVAGRTLDLVALGTVADVATLIGDTRFLVQRGLQALRHTDRPGLQAVYQAADLRAEGLTEEHIGFVLGPRLNALGRLADAAEGVELLTTSEPIRARTLAAEVEGLNARRQWLTKQVTDAALAQIERDRSLLTGYHALVLSRPTWPEGVIGIVAGRLAERFGVPVVLITTPEGKQAPDGTRGLAPDGARELARGSGRSVPGIDLVAALTDCASLLESYGGHAGAAGFSMEPERIPELRAALSRAVAARTPALPERVLAIDAYVELPDLTLDLVADVSRLAPFGAGNPPLTLAVRDLRVLSEVTLGRTGEHRRVTVEDAHERSQTVFWWHGADWPLPQGRFDLALTVRASDYRGVAEVQVEWLNARETEPAVIEVAAAPAILVTDRRGAPDPRAALRRLIAEGDVQVWAEGDGPPGAESRTRCQLQPGRRLAVWMLPPGPRELRAVLEAVQPEELILFGHDPGLDEIGAFLVRLAGLVKFALRTREGLVDLERAAAATAQRVITMQAGLELLAAQGQVRLVEQGEAHWRLAPDDTRGQALASAPPDAQAVETLRARLQALLAETAAYRDYFRNAPAAALAQC